MSLFANVIRRRVKKTNNCSRVMSIFAVIFVATSLFFSLSLAQKPEQGDPNKCNEKVSSQISNFYECVENRCLVDWVHKPWSCRTFESIPKVFTEEVVEEIAQRQNGLDCIRDSDCALVNVQYNWRCCDEGYCDDDDDDDDEKNDIQNVPTEGKGNEETGNTDNEANSKWFAVNSVWFKNKHDEYCSSFYRKHCDTKTLESNKRCKGKFSDAQKKDIFFMSQPSTLYFATCDTSGRWESTSSSKNLEEQKKSKTGKCMKVKYSYVSWQFAAASFVIVILATVIIGYILCSKDFLAVMSGNQIKSDDSGYQLSKSRGKGKERRKNSEGHDDDNDDDYDDEDEREYENEEMVIQGAIYEENAEDEKSSSNANTPVLADSNASLVQIEIEKQTDEAVE